MARMRISVGDLQYEYRASARAVVVLCLAMLSVAFVPACGGHSSSVRDTGAADGTGGTSGSDSLGADGSATGGGRGTSIDTISADDAAAIDCSYLPCLAAAVSTVAGCRPSQTCTYQTMTTGAVVRCFENGLTVITHTPSAGLVIMGVKKDGTFCYGVDSATTSGSSASTVTYRDSGNATMVTIYTSASGATHAECPNAAGSFTVPPGSACMSAVTALGGTSPGSACLDATEGDCRY